MKPEPEGGFTLVELLVALAIAGLVSLLMLHGVGVAARGVDQLAVQAERLDQRRSLEMLMRRALTSAVVIPVAVGERGFVGRPKDLGFLSVVGDGGAGLYRITLSFDAGSVTLSRRLVGHSRPPRGDRSVLLRHVAHFEIGYFGAATPTDPPGWHQEWAGIGHLPQLVRITFTAADGSAAPPIIIRLANAG